MSAKCNNCNAEHYADDYCIFCWIHILILGWSESECAELEATIERVMHQQESNHD
jgi:hypothetical protein